MYRPISQETKDKAVRLYLGSSKTIAEMAEICDVSERSFSQWIGEFRGKHPEETADLEAAYDARLRQTLNELVVAEG